MLESKKEDLGKDKRRSGSLGEKMSESKTEKISESKRVDLGK